MRKNLINAFVLLLTASYGVAQPRVFTLDEIFSSAESNSTQLRPATTAGEVAQKELSEAKASRLPDINANLAFSYIGDGFTTTRSFKDYQVAEIPHYGNTFTLTVEQPIYTGGAISTGIEMAELKSDIADSKLALTRSGLRFKMVVLYLELFKNRNMKRVVDENLAQARQVLEQMRARYNQGTALLNDITRYELLVANLELQQIKLDNMHNVLNTNLVTVAGLPEGTIVLPDTTIVNAAMAHQSETSWRDEAYASSSELKLAGTSLALSRKAEKMARSERLPKVGLQAGYSLDGPILVEVPPINRNLSYWYVGVGIKYNIASLYKSNKSVSRSKIATRQAEEQLAVERENLSLAVHSDYVQYCESFEELRTQEKSVQLAQQNYNTVSTRYFNDMALITDMLDAANSRLSAEQGLVNARINTVYQYYHLKLTSGTL